MCNNPLLWSANSNVLRYRVIEVEAMLEDIVNFLCILFSMEKTRTVKNSTIRKRQSPSRAIHGVAIVRFCLTLSGQGLYYNKVKKRIYSI